MDIQRIKYALVAIAEARLNARKETGDASNAAPTALQLERITMADIVRGDEKETTQQCFEVLKRFKKQPLGIYLYSSEHGFPANEIIKEIEEFLEY